MTMRTAKRKETGLFLAMLFLYLMMIFQSANAQSDSVSFQTKDSTFASGSEKEYTIKTWEGYDTSGYYFNWKEYPDDLYSNEKITVRISSDSTVQRLKNDDAFWYIKSIEDFKKNAVRLRYDRKYRDSLRKEGLLPPDAQVFTEEQSSNTWYSQRWVTTTIWCVIISIFVAAVVYFLLSNKINLFNKKSIKTNDENEKPENDLFSINYDQLFQKYSYEKNYRFAVRVLYLQLLKLLNERNLITYQPQFTNTHYLEQLQQSPLYPHFFTVTQHYEYIWYGEFSVSDASFQTVINDFANLKNEALHS